MQIVYPYNYVSLLALSYLMKYEEQRYVKISTLQKYHQKVVNKIVNFCKGENQNLSSQSQSEEVKIILGIENLMTFFKKYSHLCYYKDGCIYVRDDVDYYQLMNERNNYHKEEYNFIDFISDGSEELKVLGISTIRKFLQKVLKEEMTLEKKYLELDSPLFNIDILNFKKLLLKRSITLLNIANLPDYQEEAFRDVAISLEEDYAFDYEIELFDSDLWNEKNVDESASEQLEFSPLDILEDIYHYAIFGSGCLAPHKLVEMIDNVYFDIDSDSEFLDEEDYQYDDNSYFDEDIVPEDEENEEVIEESEEEYSNSTEADKYFYLNYLNKLDDYINNYGSNSELIKTRNRLLYALDMPEYALYSKEGLAKAKTEMQDMEITENDLKYLEKEMLFFANEVFTIEENINTIKKLILLSTYYELTGDKNIMEIISNYKNHEKFSFYSEVIFGRNILHDKKLIL